MNLLIILSCLVAKRMNVLCEERPLLYSTLRYEKAFKEEMDTNSTLIHFKTTIAKTHWNQLANQNHPDLMGKRSFSSPCFPGLDMVFPISIHFYMKDVYLGVVSVL